MGKIKYRASTTSDGPSVAKKLRELEGKYLNVEIRLGGFQTAILLITVGLQKLNKMQLVIDAKITRVVQLIETLSKLKGDQELDVSQFDSDMLRDLMETVGEELDAQDEIETNDDDDEDDEGVQMSIPPLDSLSSLHKKNPDGDKVDELIEDSLAAIGVK